MAKNKKVPKGYVRGGEVKGYKAPIPEKSMEGKETSFGAYASDYARSMAKYPLSVLGAGDLIKNDKARTERGRKGLETIGTAGNVIGEGAEIGLNFILPGAGSAFGLGRDAANSAVSKDESVSDTSTNIKQGANVAGGLGNTLVSGFGVDQKVSTSLSGKRAAKSNLETEALLESREAGMNALGEEMLAPDGFAHGGKIEGKGTAKSDSISMKADDDGFIVPAENAGIAGQIRASVLGESPKKKAFKNGGKVDIKVSDGEHYFSKGEVALINKAGIDLNELAPNQDMTTNFGEGGDIKPTKENADWVVAYMKENRNNPKALELARGFVKDHVDLPNSKKIKAELEKQLAIAERNLTETRKKEAIRDEIADSRKGVKADAADTTPSKSFAEAVGQKPAIDIKADKLEAPTKTAKTSGGSKAAKKAPVTPMEKIQPIDNSISILDKIQEDAKLKEANQITEDTSQASDGLGNIMPQDQSDTPVNKSFDLTRGLGPLQLGLGFMGQSQIGEAPVNTLDQTLVTNAQRARNDSAFGFSENVNASEERDIEARRRSTIGSMANVTGGSAGAQIQASGLANRIANEADLNLSLGSEKFRLAKEQRADSLDRDLSNRKDKLFGQKLDLFDKRAKANAGLMQSGLANTIGSQRYKDALSAEQERTDYASGNNTQTAKAWMNRSTTG